MANKNNKKRQFPKLQMRSIFSQDSTGDIAAVFNSSDGATDQKNAISAKLEAATFAYLYLCEQDSHIPNMKHLKRANAMGSQHKVAV